MTYCEIRPWGCFENLHAEKGWKLKKLVIDPTHRFSLQTHEHRSESWTCVSGEGIASLSNEHGILEFIELKPGQTLYIEKGKKHRLECTSTIPLIVIEVQFGEILEELDIVRYEDDYNRL